jgi:PAS domain S-box-containing protein
VVVFWLVCILLPILLLGSLFIYYNNRTTTSHINMANMRLASAMRSDVSNFLRAPVRTAIALGQLSQNPETSPHLDSLMTQMADSYGFYESIMLLDRKGIVRNLGVVSGVRLNRGDLLGLDLSRAEHVEKVLRTGQYAWSDTFISSITGEPTLSLTMPFDHGMIVGNVNLKDLSRVVAPSTGSRHAHTYLVNGKGRVIAHPDQDLVLRQENFSNRAAVAAGLSGHEGVYEYRVGDAELIGTVLKIPETGWLVVVEQDKAEEFAHLHAMQRMIMIVLAGMLLMCGFSIYYINSRVIRPVLSISSASRDVTLGVFPKLPEYAGNFRELDDLTRNFNDMSVALQQREEDLQDRNVELEHEIDERMRIEESLQGKNEELTAIEEELRNQLDETIHAQNELLSSQVLLSAMLDNSFQFQGLLTPDGMVVEVNKASLDFIGVSKEAVIGCYFWDTPWWTHDPALHTLIKSSVKKAASGESVHLEVTHRDVSGNLHVVDFSMKPAFDAHGTVLYLIPEGHDITEQRLLEQQVVQQQKLEGIGLLAGGIAHDFNNLLTPIFGYAEMIRRKFNPDDQVHARASAILDAATKAKELVQQLLSFSRKQILATGQYDLNEIVESFMTIMRRTIRENIEIAQVLCGETCPVQVDRTQIEQILLNLAVNAQDAISGNGCIRIETGHLMLDDEYCRLHPGSSPGRFIVLVFTDSGNGMDDPTLSHIFEPFFTTKPAGHGTGLGLSTVYGIVKQHGGYIDAQSKPGKGTTFRICLPAIDSEIAVGAPLAARPDVCAPAARTILLVEDNQMVMDMVRDLLTGYGHTVITADGAEEALVLASENSTVLDLLVSDVVMPLMNGPELYERLQEIIPGLKVLFMSGYANNVTVHNGTLEEGVNFIAKPFTSEEFIRRVSELLTAPV